MLLLNAEKTKIMEFKVEPENQLYEIFVKLQRADDLLQELGNGIDAYLNTDPKPHRVVKGFIEDPNRYSFFAESVRPIPLLVALMSGEIVHHCRSCLDHLVVKVAAANGQELLSSHQFPVCKDIRAFRNDFKRGRLTGLPFGALRNILKLQQFQSEDPEKSILHAIHKTDIRDKHHLLLVAEQTMAIREKIEVENHQPQMIIQGMSDPYPKELSNGLVEVFWLNVEPKNASVEFFIEFSTEVVFQDMGPMSAIPLIDVLGHMVNFTKDAAARMLPYVKDFDLDR